MRTTGPALRLQAGLAALAAAVVLGLGAGPAAPAAHAAGDDNAAVAINTKDGSSVFRFAFSLRNVAGDVVDQTNTAVAYASCEQCQTVAIALQVVLVSASSPSTIVPQNVAIAINEGCTACATAALAYQFVVGNGGPVRLTAAGRREIARIRREFGKLRGLPLDQIVARTKELVARLRNVLATELVPRGSGKDGQDGAGSGDGSNGDTGSLDAPPDGQPPPGDGQNGDQSSPDGTTTSPPPDTGTSPGGSGTGTGTGTTTTP